MSQLTAWKRFQFQEVQLKVGIRRQAWAAFCRFQFQEVQLKGHFSPNGTSCSNVSIPRGAVKSSDIHFQNVTRTMFQFQEVQLKV